jgi:putative tryptophan/tyrosine transport system substrate-binding protein
VAVGPGGGPTTGGEAASVRRESTGRTGKSHRDRWRASASAEWWFPRDDRFTAQRGLIGALAAKNRLPWLAGLSICVEAGALMSYGPDPRHYGQRVAWYVDRILKGARPADLPVEQASKFELAINLKTAKVLELTISQTLLLRADQVIE